VRAGGALGILHGEVGVDRRARGQPGRGRGHDLRLDIGRRLVDGARGGRQDADAPVPDFPPVAVRAVQEEGYEWMYVLSGRVRLRLAELDLVMKTGEAAEFDTRTPHWFGSAGPQPAELLVLFGPQGERMHLRARPRTRRQPP
jgi:hypothetical protein